MYLWKIRRPEEVHAYGEPNVAVVMAEDENTARLTLIAELSAGSDSVAAQFALPTTAVEQLGTVNNYGYEAPYVVAIESTNFREIK